MYVTHWLTYRIAVPAHHHAEVLHETGHGYWSAFAAVAVVLATAASLRVCAAGWQRKTIPTFGAVARRLAVVQAALWVVLEVGERAVGGRLATLDDHAVLLVGLVLQVAVAVAAAALLRLAHRALAALTSRRREAQSRPQPVSEPATAGRPFRLLPLAGPHGLRGPPAPLPLS